MTSLHVAKSEVTAAFNEFEDVRIQADEVRQAERKRRGELQRAMIEVDSAQSRVQDYERRLLALVHTTGQGNLDVIERVLRASQVLQAAYETAHRAASLEELAWQACEDARHDRAEAECELIAAGGRYAAACTAYDILANS